MKTAEPLSVELERIEHIIELADEARGCANGERLLYYAIKDLTEEAQAELLALYTIGRSRRTSFNLALRGARRQNIQHIAGQLTEKANLAQQLRAGLQWYRKQS